MDWSTCLVLLAFCFIIVDCRHGNPGNVDQQPGIQPFAGPGGNLGDMYCAYCRRMGWWDCVQRWCFSRTPSQGAGFLRPPSNFFPYRPYMWNQVYRKPVHYFRRKQPYGMNMNSNYYG